MSGIKKVFVIRSKRDYGMDFFNCYDYCVMKLIVERIDDHEGCWPIFICFNKLENYITKKNILKELPSEEVASDKKRRM